MNNFFKFDTTKLFIVIVILIALSLLLYVFLNNKKESDMILIIDKELVQVKLNKFTNEKNGFFASIEVLNTNEKVDDIFISKLCPLSEKNQIGKIMDINKITSYKVSEDSKFTEFDGLYEYLCTDKKDNTSDSLKK